MKVLEKSGIFVFKTKTALQQTSCSNAVNIV